MAVKGTGIFSSNGFVFGYKLLLSIVRIVKKSQFVDCNIRIVTYKKIACL